MSELLRGLAERVQGLADTMGAPGLAIIAFVDSSFLTLPQAADFLVVMFTLRNPADWWYFGMLTTAGSLAGCYALYLAGLRGGEWHESAAGLQDRRYGAAAAGASARAAGTEPARGFRHRGRARAWQGSLRAQLHRMP